MSRADVPTQADGDVTGANPQIRVWHKQAQAQEQAKLRRRGFLVRFLLTMAAVFGALVAVLAVRGGSVAAGGAVIDGWLYAGGRLVGISTPRQAAAKLKAPHQSDQAGPERSSPPHVRGQ